MTERKRTRKFPWKGCGHRSKHVSNLQVSSTIPLVEAFERMTWLMLMPIIKNTRLKINRQKRRF